MDNNKTAYVIISIVAICIIVLYIIWFYKSYDEGTGLFTPYKPEDNGNLVIIPNIQGNELFYENDSPEMENKQYMLEMGLAMLPPSQFSNDNDFSDNNVRWGLIFVIIIVFIIFIGLFLYIGTQKTGNKDK